MNPAPTPAPLETLVARLSWPDAGARRVAILDLIALSASDTRATRALLDHLAAETDERAALHIIRHLGHSAHAPALPTLWALYAQRATPAPIAHAAITEHDRILGAHPHG